MQPQPHGFLLPEVIEGKDYIFGGFSKLKGEVINPSGDWLPYVPVFEHQAPGYETNGCTNFGTNNAIELLNKYTFGDELNLSDRFSAKGSGTDPNKGNYPNKVADFMRHNWSVMEPEWATEHAKTLDEFYKPIPPELFTLAKKRMNDFGYVLEYEYVQPTKENLKAALTMGAVCMSCTIWPDAEGLYYRPNGWRDTHWLTLLKIRDNGNYVVLDSYSPFIKEIRADFVSEYAMRYELNPEVISLFKRLLEALKRWL